MPNDSLKAIILDTLDHFINLIEFLKAHSIFIRASITSNYLFQHIFMFIVDMNALFEDLRPNLLPQDQ